MKSIFIIAPLAAVLLCVSFGCSTAPKTEKGKQKLDVEVQSTLKLLITEDPTLQTLLDNAAGYAMFPSVGKGAFVVGAAYGKGHVFEDGEWIGYSDLKQGTIGLQGGGQTYHELIVFKDDAALNKFKTGQYALAANVSAAIIKANAAAAAAFNDGVVVFVKPEGGAMLEAAIGGQKFSYKPR
jgi:lipid-binding SYLF domain-containing protein